METEVKDDISEVESREIFEGKFISEQMTKQEVAKLLSLYDLFFLSILLFQEVLRILMLQRTDHNSSHPRHCRYIHNMHLFRCLFIW